MTLIRILVSMPFIYGLVLPLILLDIAMSVFQAVCFRLWRVPQVNRAAYVVLARGELPYLSLPQRVNCAYCGYANGVLAYGREIASRTEQFWCPIKHALTPAAPHERYPDFLPYGDDNNIQTRLLNKRRALRDDETGRGDQAGE